MDIRILRYFLAVAREENITRAAESLHIAQPSLSKQLMELEQEVGKQLDAGLCFRPLSPALGAGVVQGQPPVPGGSAAFRGFS